MSSSQYLSDAATRHAVFLQRYGGGRSKEAIAMLSRLRRDINARLANEPTDFQRQRLVAVLADIDQLAAAAFNDIGRKVIYDSMNLAGSEAGFSAGLFNKASTVDWALPSSATLAAGVMTSRMSAPLNAGITIEEALKQFSLSKRKQIARVITDGISLGDTTPVISRKLTGMINTLQRRQLDTLVRTIANHTSSVSRSLVYEENSDIIDGYIWIATLDSRTTLICGSRDQKVYKRPTDPKPPAHWGCRSTTIPKIKDEYDIGSKLKGKRPAVGPGGAEQVSGRSTYGSWLKKQPVEFIDEALGVERSRLFRAGKVKIGGFVDPTGRVYTLEELGRMNSIAAIE